MVNYEDYFEKLGCAYWHEYSHAYNKLVLKDKTIIMIGADCGSSALYFLLRGAKYVIAYEKEEKLRKIFYDKVCKDFSICNSITLRGEWTGNEYPDADVFVMDCEGCEDALDVNKLAKYNQWCIAIHDWAKKRVELFRALYGSVLTYISDDGREIVLCRNEEQ